MTVSIDPRVLVVILPSGDRGRFPLGSDEGGVMSLWHGRSAAVGVTMMWCGAAIAGPATVEVVRLRTSDGIEIVGDFVAAGDAAHPAPVAILLHMYGSNRSSWAPLIAPLHEAGLSTLAIDLRGHGDSGAPKTDSIRAAIQAGHAVVFRDMSRDVAAARGWLATRGDIDQARVALVGASIGCSVAFNYAIQDVSVDVVVAMTPGTGYFGLDSTIPMREFGSRPVLLMATAHEREACDKLADLNSYATKRILGKMTAHGTRMFHAQKNVAQMIVDFLSEGVGARSVSPVVSVEGGDVFYDTTKALLASVGQVKHETLRWFSSAEEATSRGLHPAR